jgi:hypoxanthine phosphoribosyltransferase
MGNLICTFLKFQNLMTISLSLDGATIREGGSAVCAQWYTMGNLICTFLKFQNLVTISLYPDGATIKEGGSAVCA